MYLYAFFSEYKLFQMAFAQGMPVRRVVRWKSACSNPGANIVTLKDEAKSRKYWALWKYKAVPGKWISSSLIWSANMPGPDLMQSVLNLGQHLPINKFTNAFSPR